MELVLGYLAGLLTLINPCVLPILPIVLATSLQAGRRGPLALAGGMSVAFVALGMLVTVFGRALGVTEQMISDTGAVLVIGFGLVLLVPRLSAGFATATAGVSANAEANLDEIDNASISGQFVAGMLLGAIWSPCIGPTLGGAISLASQGEGLGWAAATMTSFALGVSTIILALGYGARAAIHRRQATMRAVAQKARPIMGAVFVAVGAAILLKFHHVIEIWALETLPTWLVDFSVSL